MKILLDLQTLQSESRNRGIGRYSHGLAAALLSLGRHDWHALLNLQMESCEPPGIASDRIHYFDSLTPVRGLDPANKRRMVLSEAVRDAFISSRSFDVVHVSSPFDGFGDDTVVSWPTACGALLTATVYDFIPFRMREEYLPNATIADWFSRRFEGLRKADLLFAISEHTRREAIEMLSIDPARVVNIGADADPIFRPVKLGRDERDGLLRRYGIERPFVIHAGIPEKRKNVETLIAAWALLPPELRDSHEIVLAGAITGAQRADLQALSEKVGAHASALKFVGFVPDHDLVPLYGLARAAVMPSLAEGFGLPLLEAMRCGCPVLGSNTTSIPEVVGHADLMFDPRRPDDLAARLHLILTEAPFRRFAIEHAAAQQAIFSWRRSATTMIEALETALRTRQHAAGTERRLFHVIVPPELEPAQQDLLSAFRRALPDHVETVETSYDEVRAGPLIDRSATPTVTILTARTAGDLPADIVGMGPAICLVGDGCAPPSTATDRYRLFGWSSLSTEGETIGEPPPLTSDNAVALLRRSAHGDGWILRGSRAEHDVHVAGTELAGALQSLWDQNAAAGLLRCIPFVWKTLEDEPNDADYGLVATTLANNHGARPAPRLYVDITHLARHDAKTGIQRVVRNVLRHLLRTRGRYRVEPVYRDGADYRFARAYTGRFIGARIQLPDAIVDFQPGDVFLGLDLELTLTSEAAANLRRHRLRGLRTYFVVYDVLPLERPDWFLRGMSEMFASWLSHLGTLADGLFCISKATAAAVEAQLRSQALLNPRLRIEAFQLGADLEGDIGADADNTDLPFGGEANDRLRFLSVATLEPRKGHRQMLDAFERLWLEDYDVDLVFVGRTGWNTEHLIERIRAHPELGRRLFWFEGPSDAALNRIYERCSAILAASEGEGYGLPLVEAARHGLPIIARDLQVFREIAGEEAHYFSGLQGSDLARAVARWIDLHGAGGEPKPRHVPIVSWAESTGQLLGLIDRAERPAALPETSAARDSVGVTA